VKPLQSIAMGLVIILVFARINGDYDVLPDPVGWLLVLQGLAALPDSLPHRPALRSLGFVALLMSIVLWFPDLARGLDDADESLVWAATLPQLAFVAVLCRALATVSTVAGDPRPAAWWRTGAALTILAAALPILTYTIDQDLLGPMTALAALTLAYVVVTLFRFASRPWAQAPGDPGDPA
jgi:hypothetical protein